MRIFDTRALVGFAVGAGVAVLCTVAGASFAQQPAARAPAPPAKASAASSAAAGPLVTAGCANKKTGAIAIIGSKHKSCTSKEKSVSFATPVPGPHGPAGPQGPAGGGGSILQPDGSLVLTGDMRITSKNGAYILVLGDDGVGLKGPGGSVAIDPFSLTTVNNEKSPN